MLDHKLALVAVALSVAAAACQSSTESPGSQPAAPSPKASGTLAGPPSIQIARRLGRAPSDCRGPHPTRRRVAPAYAPLIGEEPLWAGFYARYDSQDHTFTTRDSPRTKHGFRVKILWIMSPKHDQGVTLTGENVRTGAPVRFDLEEVGTTERPTLTPEVAGVGETKWREFPSYAYFDRAGCFMLTTTWGKDSWRLGFGFGR
jgi:hypothetical protein